MLDSDLSKDNNTEINIRSIVSFSFPIALQESLYTVVHWLTMMIMVKYANYSELGISTATAQWNAVILFIPGALRNVALSYLSESNSDNGKNKSVLFKLMAINFITTFIPFVIIFILSGWISSWYGNTYIGFKDVLNICVFTTIFTSLSNVVTNALMASSHNWYLFFTRLIRDLTILIIGTYSIIHYGHAALTMAIVTLACSILYLLLILTKQIQLLKSQNKYGAQSKKITHI